MNKPILAAFGAFTGSSLAVLGVNFLKHEEFAFSHALTLASAMAFSMYVITQWKQQQKESHSEPNDLNANEEGG